MALVVDTTAEIVDVVTEYEEMDQFFDDEWQRQRRHIGYWCCMSWIWIGTIVALTIIICLLSRRNCSAYDDDDRNFAKLIFVAGYEHPVPAVPPTTTIPGTTTTTLGTTTTVAGNFNTTCTTNADCNAVAGLSCTNGVCLCSTTT